MKKGLVFSIVCGLFVLLAVSAQADVVINEIMTNNGVFTDGEHYDWIELYNNGTKTVNLSGWGLSDTRKDLMQFQFPKDTLLKGGQSLLVYCTGEEGIANNPRRSLYYSSFKLSDDGETIYLTDANGETQDKLKYPQQYGNTAYGLAADGETWGYFDNATPLKANGKKVYASQAVRPVIETAAGFYTLGSGEKMQVVISGEGEIRYTLDGSEPTRDSALYTGPISIKQTTVVRARTCDGDKIMSPSVGATYIINDPSVVGVVSVSTDSKYLYDPSMGIFVRGNNAQSNYYYDWEYPLFFEYFDVNGDRQLAQNVSFHVTGTSTRGYSQKSFAVHARDAYGDENRFNYNPFKNRDYDSYKAFTVRSTGSDVVAARIRDAAFTALAKDLGIMYLDATPVVVYLNGDYHGHYNLREKVNKHSIAQWEGIEDKDIIDRIDVLEGMADDERIQNGDNDDWLALREYVKKNDLNDPVHLKYVTDRLDVDSFFTWVSFEIGCLNADLENVRVYRVPGGKWKYILYDVEAGGVSDMRALYMLMDSSRAGSRVSSQYSLLHNLLKVPEMKDRFLTVFAHVMEHCFLYETKVDPVFDEWVEVLEQLLPRHFQKYPIMNIFEWRANVRAVRFYIRIMPRRVILEVGNILKLTPQERDHYFGEVLSKLEVQNADDKE